MSSQTQFDLFDSQSNTLLSSTKYSEFAKALSESNCQKCALSESRTNIVIDRGNPQASIMVIGEAPGENEDLKAKAFVGRAGKLLDQIMASVGLDTNKDMIICNVVKCRPPGNRAPKEDEAKSCINYLKHQIQLVEPKLILLLGATALKHMDPSKKGFAMEDQVGKFFDLSEYPNIKFVVLYHPAALLYNSKLKPVMWSHVKTIKNYLDSLQTANSH